MITLRPYQQECIDKSLAALKEWDKVCAVLPTSAGKTVIFTHLVLEWLKENPGKKVFILSHLNLLTAQTKNKFEEYFEGQVTPYILQAQEIAPQHAQLVIGTMQSGRVEDKIKAWLGNDYKANSEVGLVIVDETHHIQCESYAKIMKFFPKAKVFGVTATPFRENKLMTDYFDDICYSISIQNLIDQKYLVPPTLNEIRFTGDDTDRYKMIAQLLTNEAATKQTVVYMKEIKQAEEVNTLLRSIGIASELIVSNVSIEERERYFHRFKHNGIRVLVTCDVLSEGFDAPCIDAIILPFKINSAAKYMQRVGRGLRLYEGKTDCQVYAFGSTPDIESGFWRKINDQVLNKKKKVFDTLEAEAEFQDQDFVTTTKLNYTQTLLAIAKQVKESSDKVYRLITMNKLPKAMLFGLSFLQKPEVKVPDFPNGNWLCSSKQATTLKNFGVPEDQLKNMTLSEASMLIDLAFKAKEAKKAYVAEGGIELCAGGKYQGTPLSEVPIYYMKLIAYDMKYSKTLLAQQFRNYLKSKN